MRIDSTVEHHLLMITEDWNQVATMIQFDQEIENSSAVRSTVDVITQRDDGVVRSGDDGVKIGFQCRSVSVNVTNGDQSSCF